MLDKQRSDLVMPRDEMCRQVPDALLLAMGKGLLEGALQRLVRPFEKATCGFWGLYPPNTKLCLRLAAPADVTAVPSVADEGFRLSVIKSVLTDTSTLAAPVGRLPKAVCNLSSEMGLPTAATGSSGEKLSRALARDLNLMSAEESRYYCLHPSHDCSVVVAHVPVAYLERIS
jgi:hypothetical protein